MSDAGRRTKQWGPLKGPTKQANATAALLRSWLDNARLRLDDVRPLLTPEHFSNNRVPSRSTIGERLAGVRLEEDFVQAIADVCSGDDAALREQLLQEAAAVAAREHGIRPPHGAARNLDAAVPASELVAEQRRSLALQDRLLRAMERAVELEHERTGAHRMVCVLLTMVDKLQRDIAALSVKRDKLQGRADEHHQLDTVRRQLARSEEQRRTAEASLQRAQDERSKADRLAAEAAEQIRTLTAELEQLRQQAAGQPDNSPPLTISDPADPIAQDMEAAADDIDDALVKASRHLDDGARRLDDLARELHQDNPPDNSTGPASAGEETAEPDAKADVDVLAQDILQMLRRMREGNSSFVDLALTAAADFIVGLMDVVLRYGKDEEDWDMAYGLLEVAAAKATPAHICALITELHARGGEMYAHRLLSVIATQRLPLHIVDIVAALRESQQPAAAYQLLSAVGRDRPAWYIQPILWRLSSSDATWLLDAVTAERTPFDIAQLRAILRNSGPEQYAELLPDLTLGQAWAMPSIPYRSATRQLVT
ncbi:hypothetical protein [Streptomyces justiciae]|uniref:hypothetical protein n=1 Tax=Streptomyces justiciae TaxID=2780140 RepID=UPI00188159D5|nr:hypothetical protein [Streptomyces justiciae]MBE8477488.1 hypothetical protein [Streptomyces justiciae]